MRSSYQPMASELRLDSLGDTKEISQPPDFQVEDVTGKQLEAALQTEELLAVMFCEYQLHHCWGQEIYIKGRAEVIAHSKY